MAKIMEDTQKVDGRAPAGLSVPPGPPEFPSPQRLHPGPRSSVGLQALYLGKCPYRAVENVLDEVALAPWRRDVHFAEARSLGGHCGPGEVGPWIARQVDPTGSPLWLSGPKAEKW